MKFNLIETKEILDLEKEIGFELVVNERHKSTTTSQYYVSFEGGKVMEGSCLVGSCGDGNTIDEAIIDCEYFLQLRSKNSINSKWVKYEFYFALRFKSKNNVLYMKHNYFLARKIN